MTQPPADRRDGPMEQVLGNLLRAGVVTAALVVLAGGALYLYQHGAERPDRQAFHGEPASLRTPGAIIGEALAGNSTGIIQLGILLLIATPVLRVAFSVVAFAWEGDVLYVGLTMGVLTLLLVSLFLLG